VKAAPCDLLFAEFEEAGVDLAGVRLLLDRDGWRVEFDGAVRPARPTPEQALRHLLDELRIRPQHQGRLKCEAKNRYPTWPSAELHRHFVEAWTRRIEGQDLRLRSYPCRECGSWHHATVRRARAAA
jgi:hypothetical protein